MNRYGRLARDHWKSTDPSRYSQIQDLWLQLAGPDPVVPENTLHKVGRLNMARLRGRGGGAGRPGVADPT